MFKKCNTWKQNTKCVWRTEATLCCRLSALAISRRRSSRSTQRQSKQIICCLNPIYFYWIGNLILFRFVLNNYLFYYCSWSVWFTKQLCFVVTVYVLQYKHRRKYWHRTVSSGDTFCKEMSLWSTFQVRILPKVLKSKFMKCMAPQTLLYNLGKRSIYVRLCNLSIVLVYRFISMMKIHLHQFRLKPICKVASFCRS